MLNKKELLVNFGVILHLMKNLSLHNVRKNKYTILYSKKRLDDIIEKEESVFNYQAYQFCRLLFLSSK